MSQLLTGFVKIIAGIIIVAVIVLIVKKQSGAASVISGFSTYFDKLLKSTL